MSQLSLDRIQVAKEIKTSENYNSKTFYVSLASDVGPSETHTEAAERVGKAIDVIMASNTKAIAQAAPQAVVPQKRTMSAAQVDIHKMKKFGDKMSPFFKEKEQALHEFPLSDIKRKYDYYIQKPDKKNKYNKWFTDGAEEYILWLEGRTAPDSIMDELQPPDLTGVSFNQDNELPF